MEVPLWYYFHISFHLETLSILSTTGQSQAYPERLCSVLQTKHKPGVKKAST